MPERTSHPSADSSVHMPASDDVTMTFRSWPTLLSRIRLRTAGVATNTSNAATLPPPIRGSSS